MSPDQAVGVFKAITQEENQAADGGTKFKMFSSRRKILSPPLSSERSVLQLRGPALRFVRSFVTCSDTIVQVDSNRSEKAPCVGFEQECLLPQIWTLECPIKPDHLMVCRMGPLQGTRKSSDNNTVRVGI